MGTRSTKDSRGATNDESLRESANLPKPVIIARKFAEDLRRVALPTDPLVS